MKITIQYRYIAEVIPPRCRKSRRVEQASTITLTIHEVTATEAPIAIVERSHDWDDNSNEIPVAVEYRWWGKRLWIRSRFQRVSRGEWETQTAAQFQQDPYPFDLAEPSRHDYHWYESLSQRRAGFRRWAASILFVDGERWVVSGEPRYVIMTFGLGHNHGLGHGTDLTTDTGYNGNIGRGRYFRVDQYALALAETARIATARGDTKALPVEETQQPTRFDILIPEAVRLNPAREHGNGCAFTNGIEAMIESTSDRFTAGLMVMSTAVKLIAELPTQEKGRSVATHRAAPLVVEGVL